MSLNCVKCKKTVFEGKCICEECLNSMPYNVYLRILRETVQGAKHEKAFDEVFGT